MTAKFLQLFGLLALLGLAGGSLAALAIVKDRIHLTVEAEEDAARRGPDPIAVLEADVAATREEVRALGDGVGQRMQLLHDALETAAEERERATETALAGLRTEFMALRTQIGSAAQTTAASQAEFAASLARLSAGIDSVVGSRTLGVEAAPALASAEITSPEPDVAPVAVLAVEEPAAAPITPEPVAAKPATKGFLSFQLPSEGFVFDRRQRYSILPSLSRVGFDAKSTLHDFSGVTTSVEGEITANLARPAEGCGGSVRAKSASLDTGLDERDESMREILEPAKYPDLRFDWASFEPTSVDATARKVVGIAKGKLTIHGVSRDVAMTVSVVVDASKRLAIEGQTKIRLSDHGVRPPSKLGLISVEDEATLWIALRARTLGSVEEAAR